MKSSMSKLCQVLFSYILGITTCFIILQLYICKDQLGLNTFKRVKHHIYFSNELYNSRGLLNEGENDDVYDRYLECMDIYSKFHDDEVMIEPPLKKPHRPAKKNRSKSQKIFINCGGTFPWSVELFLDTYPQSTQFQIFSFVKDASYSVMYKKFANHTLYPVEASTSNTTVNKGVQCFGCGFPITEKVIKIDIANWIKSHTRKRDLVILRVESDEEREIVSQLFDRNVFENIDKYYTTSTDPEFLEFITKELSTRSQSTVVQTWHVANQTYSDFLKVNAKSIPIKGSLINKCQDTNNTEKFALFLYSKTSSMNIVTLVNLLRQFSHKNMVSITLFLPYQFYMSNYSNMQWVFETFSAGLYYSTNAEDHNVSLQLPRSREMSLRNTAITVQNVFKAHGSYLQNIMYSPVVDMETIQETMLEYNYNFFAHGVDITHLIDHVLDGGTITMDMTGWEIGKYLMIDVDTFHSEYLVLYMARRFVPWLLEVSQCSIPRPG